MLPKCATWSAGSSRWLERAFWPSTRPTVGMSRAMSTRIRRAAHGSHGSFVYIPNGSIHARGSHELRHGPYVLRRGQPHHGAARLLDRTRRREHARSIAAHSRRLAALALRLGRRDGASRADAGT